MGIAPVAPPGAAPAPVEPDEDEAPAGLAPSTKYVAPPSFAPARPAPREPAYPAEDDLVDEEGLPPTGYHDSLADDVRDLEDEQDAAPYEGDYAYDGEYAEDDLEYEDDNAADYDDGYADEYAEDEEPAEEDEASPAKQWLAMAAQLAIGVVGGAGVWLGFNWLWGQLPAAALVAALVVVVALVWIVRKIRRADDIQTTVFAVLVGLVVTVSPAALLLLAR